MLKFLLLPFLCFNMENIFTMVKNINLVFYLFNKIY